jgi:hypothetical protein
MHLALLLLPLDGWVVLVDLVLLIAEVEAYLVLVEALLLYDVLRPSDAGLAIVRQITALIDRRQRVIDTSIVVGWASLGLIVLVGHLSRFGFLLFTSQAIQELLDEGPTGLTNTSIVIDRWQDWGRLLYQFICLYQTGVIYFRSFIMKFSLSNWDHFISDLELFREFIQLHIFEFQLQLCLLFLSLKV